MQVSSISSTSFKSNAFDEPSFFISKEAKQNAQSLLKLMNQKTKYQENDAGTGWMSNILASVSLDKNHKFTDSRFYIAPTDRVSNNISDCMVSFGDYYACINSSTGEVVSYKKGWLTTKRGFANRIASFINYLLKNFDNDDIVQKNIFGIKGFTKKGLDIIQKRL